MFDPHYSTPPTGLFLIALYLMWILPWKGFALWRAAQNKHAKWFVALLIVNTLALLEIIYIFYFSKNKSKWKFPWSKR